MAIASIIAIFTIAVSSLTFIAFFGRLPAFRYTPIGFLHRLLVQHIPAFLAYLDRKLTHGRITSGGSRLGHYLMYEKHPVVMIFFLGLVTVSAALFISVMWPYLPAKHKLLIPLLLPQPYIFTYLSAKQHPDLHVNPRNHERQMRYYPYDRVLYYPGMVCSTCQFLKPPRSKHCSICRTCVARMDHHCAWVNNCLGRGNYKYFLALLLSTAVLLAYGAYLAHLILSPMVQAAYIKYERFYKYPVPLPATDALDWSTYLHMKLHYFLSFVSLYLDVGGVRASGVGLLALLTWPLPLGLLGYHVYLMYAGMTTNETSKWADWRDDMADGVVFLGHRRQDTMRNGHYYPPPPPAPAMAPTAPYLTPAPASTTTPSQTSSTSASPIPTPPETPSEEEEPPTSWPLESRHILIRTSNGLPPRNIPGRIASVAEADNWERVWSLAAVENVYDLGFWDNFVEFMQ